MKLDELDVYDAYPHLMGELVAACLKIQQLPLEKMLSANARIILTGTFIGPDASRVVDVKSAQAHRRLIELATTFRDAFQSQ